MLKCVSFDFNVLKTFLCIGFTIAFFSPHMKESEQPVSNLYFRLKTLFSCVVAKFNKSLVSSQNCLFCTSRIFRNLQTGL